MEFESQRLELLNFEVANQSVFHSLIPIGFGIAFLREDSNLPENLSEEDEDSETETEMESGLMQSQS